MRIVALVIGGFFFLACRAELQAQARDTSTARVQAFPKPAKTKAQPANSAAARARADTTGKGIVPPKSKTTPAAPRVDSAPAIAKPPKGSRPSA